MGSTLGSPLAEPHRGGRRRMPAERIETDRVVVERLTTAHAESLAVAVAGSRDELAQWMPWYGDDAESADHQRDRIVALEPLWESGQDYSYAIVLAADASVFGAVSLFRRRSGEHSIEVGYWISTDQVGKGLAAEAVGAVVNEAFQLVGVRQIESSIDAANVRSRRLIAALGFRWTGDVEVGPTALAETGVHGRFVINSDDWNAR